MNSTAIRSQRLHFAELPTQEPDGNLYVSDFYAHEVLKFDLTTSSDPGQFGIGCYPVFMVADKGRVAHP